MARCAYSHSPPRFPQLARTAIFRRRNNSFGYVGISGRIEIASKTDAHDPLRSWLVENTERAFRRYVRQQRACAVTGHSSNADTRRDADPQRPLTACLGGIRQALARRARRVTNRIRSPR